MKKSYLLLCLMTLTSLLLICNPVLADEQNSENDRWEALGKSAAEGVAEAAATTGSLIGAGAAEAAAAEIVNQGFKAYEDYKEIKRADKELDEGGSTVAYPAGRMDGMWTRN